MSMSKDEFWHSDQELPYQSATNAKVVASAPSLPRRKAPVRASLRFWTLMLLRYGRRLARRLSVTLLIQTASLVIIASVIIYAASVDASLRLWAFDIALVFGAVAAIVNLHQPFHGSPPLPKTVIKPRRLYSNVRHATPSITHVASQTPGQHETSEAVVGQSDQRMQILTAFSHDVQTPITRMRLRLELADDFPEQQKLLSDLREAEQLIRDGIAYAKNSHICSEVAIPVDLRSFVESVVFDYQDTGRPVTLLAIVEGVLMLKPVALRRILSNFVDNALKYAGSAELAICRSRTGNLVISVLDQGPGIACDKIESVKEPFVRLERDQSSGVSGIGLGLAIANQLAEDMNAKLHLANRVGGGLSAQIEFCVKREGSAPSSRSTIWQRGAESR